MKPAEQSICRIRETNTIANIWLYSIQMSTDFWEIMAKIKDISIPHQNAIMYIW